MILIISYNNWFPIYLGRLFLLNKMYLSDQYKRTTDTIPNGKAIGINGQKNTVINNVFKTFE